MYTHRDAPQENSLKACPLFWQGCNTTPLTYVAAKLSFIDSAWVFTWEMIHILLSKGGMGVSSLLFYN